MSEQSDPESASEKEVQSQTDQPNSTAQFDNTNPGATDIEKSEGPDERQAVVEEASEAETTEPKGDTAASA